MKNQFGQILIEAILALALTMFIITGIVIALISSLNNSTFTKNQNLASSLAQEGIDIARNQKDSDYAVFSALGTLSTTYCLIAGDKIINIEDKKIASCPKINGLFVREIVINQGGSPCGPSVLVSSSVTWNDNRCKAGVECHKVELNSCFSDLNKIQP